MDGPWAQQNLDAGATAIMPVPAPLGGAVVLAEHVATYFSAQQPMKSAALKQTVIKVKRRLSRRAGRLCAPTQPRCLLPHHMSETLVTCTPPCNPNPSLPLLAARCVCPTHPASSCWAPLPVASELCALLSCVHLPSFPVKS